MLSVTFDELAAPDGGNVANIASGADGNLWFTNPGSDSVNRISAADATTASASTVPMNAAVYFPRQFAPTYGPGTTIPAGTAIPAGTVTEYILPTPNADPEGVCVDTAGNVFIAERAAHAVVKMTPDGAISNTISTQGAPYQLTTTGGSSAAVWFTETGSSSSWIGRIDDTPNGTPTLSEVALNAGVVPQGIAAGADGDIWFTDTPGDRVWRLSAVDQSTTPYAVPTPASQPGAIAADAYGNLWFTEAAGQKIGRVNVQTLATRPIDEFALSAANADPFGITAGPDGNMWFTESGTPAIGQITLAGAVTEYPPLPDNAPAYGITAGPDGNLWFGNYIGPGRVNLPGSVLSITTMNVPNSPVVVSAGGSDVQPNQLIDFQVPIFSNGPDPAQGVVLTVTLPAGVTFYVTGSGNDGTLSGNTVTFNVGNLSPRTGLVEDVFATAAQPGTYTATAHVTCSSPQKNLSEASASASATVVRGADLAVTSMQASNTAPTVGDDFSYTMTVINNGPDVAKGAVLTDVLPAGLQFVVNGSTGVYDDTTGTFTQDMGDLDPGVPVNVTINVQATKTGTFSNTATASCHWPDSNSTNDSQTVDVSVGVPLATSGVLNVSVTGDGAASAQAHSTFGMTPAASAEPLISASGIATITVSSQVPFATPTVILTFDDGTKIRLDNAGQPSVAILDSAANDYVFTYVEDVHAAQWPAGPTTAPANVWISVAGVDLEGNPLSTHISQGPSFGIVATTTISASTPALTLSSTQLPNWAPVRDGYDSFGTINVPFGSDFKFQARSTIPNAGPTSNLRLFAAGILPAPLTLTDHFGFLSTQDQTSHSANPAFLNGDFTPSSTDIGHTFYLALDALNLNTQESTAGILKLHVVNSDGSDPGTGGPDITVTTSPLGFAPPANGGVVSIDIHIHSDSSPLTTPRIEVFAPGSQTPIPFTGAVFADQLLDGSLDYSDYDAIETFAATDPVGVYRFRVTAQDRSKKYSLSGAGNVYVYDGTPGDLSNLTGQLLQQPQNQPSLLALQLAYAANQIDGGLLAAGPVPGTLFIDGTPSHPVVSTIMPTATGFVLLDQAGQVIAQGGGNVISHDGGTFTFGGSGNNVTLLNAQGLIGHDGGSLIAAGGGNVISHDGGTLIGHDGGSFIAVADSLVANATSSNHVALALPGLADPLIATGGGNFTYNGTQIPLINMDGASIISDHSEGVISDNGAGLLSSLSSLTGFANGQSLIQLASGASFANSLGTSAFTSAMAGPAPLGTAITRSASPATSPSGVASTPLGAAQDAMLYADIMARHELELLQNGQPPSVTKTRGDDAIAALDAATVALNQGFAALTPEQLTALQRAGSVIMLNVSPATPGGTVAPGSNVVLTPVNAADALATSTASAPAGQGAALTLGGSVVTVGGVLPSPLQPGARLNVVPLNGQSAYLLSAAPNQVVAQLPTFLPTNGPQLIVLTTADGRLAIGAVNVHPATGSIQFSAPTYTWGKNGATANVIVTRTGGSSGATGAIFSTSDGTAAAGVDYTATSDMVSFGDGDSRPQLISIPLLAGDGSTGGKTISLSLSSPLNGASIGTQATATLTLQDGLGTIQGQVFEDRNGDGTIQTGEPGLANAIVFIDTNGDGVLNNPVSGDNVGDLNATEPFTVTDSQGNYTLGALAPGTYTVRVVVPGDRTETTAATQTVTIDGSGAVVKGEDFGLSPALTAGTPGTPALAAQSDTGASNSDGISQNNGSPNAPLTFDVSETGGTTDFFRLYDVTNPANPVLLGGPVQAAGGIATVTVSGTTLANGIHQIAVTAAATATSPESPVSSTLAITIDPAAPASTVAALPATSGINIPVSWAGTDNTGGSGVSSYSVFVSDNAGSFAPWLTSTTQTAATFTGTYGHTYAFYSLATDVAGNAQAAPASAQATTQTVATPLQVTGVSPNANFLTSLPNNQIVLTFNRALASLSADKADGSGFAGAPFSVMLLPSGPDGLATQQQTGVYWSAPTGFDSGVLPIPATAVYHLNADGTSTVTLTPNQPLATDIYLITVDGLNDPFGDPLSNATGTAQNFYASFDYRPTPVDLSPLNVTSVTTQNGSIPINNKQIPQPDTIAIAFNKPLDTYTVNSGTVQLLAKNGSIYTPVAAAVAYSPTTGTAYLTPEAALLPGTTYVVSVSGSVSDDQGFPNPGVTLGQASFTTFTVSGPGPGLGASAGSTLSVLKTNPLNGTAWNAPLGYGAVTFSEAVDMASLGRFSAMLVPHTGGVTTGGSGYADVPVNAKLAFNPNTNQLIIVPTGTLRDHTVYLFSLKNITARNGGALSGGTVFSTFLLNSGAAAHAAPAPPDAAESAPVPVPPGPATTTPVVPAVAVRRHRHSTASPRPRRPGLDAERPAASVSVASKHWPLGPYALARRGAFTR